MSLPSGRKGKVILTVAHLGTPYADAKCIIPLLGGLSLHIWHRMRVNVHRGRDFIGPLALLMKQFVAEFYALRPIKRNTFRQV